LRVQKKKRQAEAGVKKTLFEHTEIRRKKSQPRWREEKEAKSDVKEL
jgi:hypothetical protein